MPTYLPTYLPTWPSALCDPMDPTRGQFVRNGGRTGKSQRSTSASAANAQVFCRPRATMSRFLPSPELTTDFEFPHRLLEGIDATAITAASQRIPAELYVHRTWSACLVSSTLGTIGLLPQSSQRSSLCPLPTVEPACQGGGESSCCRPGILATICVLKPPLKI
ncbi:hypothetical protein LZ31DRAFT_329477 [Colletotrichum somersetense]|nr:hypothetical protein LZ31DRAFT_329477 [Colletotrichum somersetense]